MKVVFYLSKILLYLSMVIFGFLALTAWVALGFKYQKPAYGWVLFGALVVGYAGICVASRLKKYPLLFVSALVFPVVNLFVGLSLRNLPQVKGNLSFNGVFLRNHILPLMMIVFAGLIWASFLLLPEQRGNRRLREHRRLEPEEHIL